MDTWRKDIPHRTWKGYQGRNYLTTLLLYILNVNLVLADRVFNIYLYLQYVTILWGCMRINLTRSRMYYNSKKVGI